MMNRHKLIDTMNRGLRAVVPFLVVVPGMLIFTALIVGAVYALPKVLIFLVIPGLILGHFSKKKF